jgi:hypothetical protein
MKQSLTTTLCFINENIAQRVTAMGVKAHMDPYFTLKSGCLIDESEV